MADGGSEAAANGMLRCTRCSRYFAPDDIQGFTRKDFRDFVVECCACWIKRVGPEKS